MEASKEQQSSRKGNIHQGLVGHRAGKRLLLFGATKCGDQCSCYTRQRNDKAEMESNSILSIHPTVLSLSFNNTKENDSSDETLKNLSVSNSLDEVNKHDLEKSNEAKYQGTISKREGIVSNNIQSKKTEGNLDLKLQSGLENDQIIEKKDTHFSSKVKIEVKEEVDDELRNGFEVLDTINFQ